MQYSYWDLNAWPFDAAQAQRLLLWATSAHCWVMSHLSPTRIPKLFWAGLFIPQPVLVLESGEAPCSLSCWDQLNEISYGLTFGACPGSSGWHPVQVCQQHHSVYILAAGVPNLFVSLMKALTSTGPSGGQSLREHYLTSVETLSHWHCSLDVTIPIQ